MSNVFTALPRGAPDIGGTFVYKIERAKVFDMDPTPD
jgi:hypothetical protein